MHLTSSLHSSQFKRMGFLFVTSTIRSISKCFITERTWVRSQPSVKNEMILSIIEPDFRHKCRWNVDILKMLPLKPLTVCTHCRTNGIYTFSDQNVPPCASWAFFSYSVADHSADKHNLCCCVYLRGIWVGVSFWISCHNVNIGKAFLRCVWFYVLWAHHSCRTIFHILHKRMVWNAFIDFSSSFIS